MDEHINFRHVTCPMCGGEAFIVEQYVYGPDHEVVGRRPRPGGFVCWENCSPRPQQLERISAA